MKTFKKVAIISGSLIAILATLLIFSLFWEGKPNNLIAEAAKFRPPNSWQLKDEHIEPVRLICAGDYACPSLDRHWKVGNTVNTQELENTLDKTGWSGFSLSSCGDIENKLKSGQKYSCTLTSNDHGYSIQFYLNLADNDKSVLEASLFLSKS